MKNEQSDKNITKSEVVFSIVIERLRMALKLDTYADISRALGISSSNFSNRKASDSLPFEAIVKTCLEQSISLDWVFTGSGHAFTNNEDLPKAFVEPVDARLLGSIVAEIGYAESEDFNPSKDALAQGYAQNSNRPYVDDLWRGICAGTILNKVRHLKGKDLRVAIFKEVSKMVEPTRLFHAVQCEAAKRANED